MLLADVASGLTCRHPLLLGDWLLSQDTTQRSRRRGASGAAQKGAAPAASKQKAKSRRRLSNRKDDTDAKPINGSASDEEADSSGPICPVRQSVSQVLVAHLHTSGVAYL